MADEILAVRHAGCIVGGGPGGAMLSPEHRRLSRGAGFRAESSCVKPLLPTTME
jgi:hypothetical protein